MCVRVLLVEDDERIRQALSLALSDEGFTVDEASSGEEGVRRSAEEPFDVVLVDLTLPGIGGLEVVRTLRTRGDLPIIVVTARTDPGDVIAGLESGADDYVTKPLLANVLAARVRALLRRRGPNREAVRIGELEIRPQEGLVHRAGERVHLTRTEFRLLLELAGAGGRIVTREQLLRKVWGYDYFGDTRLLDVHMRRLRRKVEADPDDPSLLLTVRGAGYRIGS
ncbi:response regulator transcription factor [Lentzea jiangxiensis]|uniref:DNA-binding response regulator, OmpR family, contains REC and winged-helix (WHTH) domain n=1 Tax=Lentzea jiangxiensis TaxID=641025 RepID=A0A1H0WWM1_9PSEU|nr:response regulator transcription factor [Lentzea jiangxiensis]SDP94989.1 DNA-binding response regulator, OmpR family, contains REC and winged-helix (wHTH) domain [Lentzea jiangxiensis]